MTTTYQAMVDELRCHPNEWLREERSRVVIEQRRLRVREVAITKVLDERDALRSDAGGVGAGQHCEGGGGGGAGVGVDSGVGGCGRGRLAVLGAAGAVDAARDARDRCRVGSAREAAVAVRSAEAGARAAKLDG